MQHRAGAADPGMWTSNERRPGHLTSSIRGRVLILLLYAAVSTALGHVDYHIRAHPERGFAEYSPSVTANLEPPPGRYRVLGPFAYEGLRTLSGLSPRAAWVLFRWLCLFGSLAATHLYFRTWFDDGPAVGGALLVAALLPLTFTNSWAHPDHLLELGLFTLGCAAIARGWIGTFLVVLILNALNRETSAFLLPLLFLAYPLTRRHFVSTSVACLVWLATYVGLRWWRGLEWYDPWQVHQNLVFLHLLPPNYDPYYRAYAWFIVVLAAPLVWAVVMAWRVLPRGIRAGAAVVAPAFAVTCFLWSSIIETRIFTPLIPLITPAVLFALFPRSHDRETT